MAVVRVDNQGRDDKAPCCGAGDRGGGVLCCRLRSGILADAGVLSPSPAAFPRGVAVVPGVIVRGVVAMPLQVPVPRPSVGHDPAVPCSEVYPEGADDPVVLAEGRSAVGAACLLGVIQDLGDQEAVEGALVVEGVDAFARAAPPVLRGLVELADDSALDRGNVPRACGVDDHACWASGKDVVAFLAGLERLEQAARRPAPAAFPPPGHARPLFLCELLGRLGNGQRKLSSVKVQARRSLHRDVVAVAAGPDVFDQVGRMVRGTHRRWWHIRDAAASSPSCGSCEDGGLGGCFRWCLGFPNKQQSGIFRVSEETTTRRRTGTAPKTFNTACTHASIIAWLIALPQTAVVGNRGRAAGTLSAAETRAGSPDICTLYSGPYTALPGMS